MIKLVAMLTSFLTTFTACLTSEQSQPTEQVPQHYDFLPIKDVGDFILGSDNKIIAVTKNGELAVIDASSGKELVKRLALKAKGIEKVAYAPKANVIAVATLSTVYLYEISAGMIKPTDTIDVAAQLEKAGGAIEKIASLQMADDGTVLGWGGHRSDAVLCSLKPEKNVKSACTRIARLDPGGNLLFTWNPRNLMYAIYNDGKGTYTGRLVPGGRGLKMDVAKSLAAKSFTVTSMVFSYSGDRLVIAGPERSGRGIELWNTATQKIEKVLTGALAPQSLALTRDAKYLFAHDSQESNIKVWNTSTGKRLRSLAPLSPENRTLNLQLSSDDAYLYYLLNGSIAYQSVVKLVAN